MGSAPLGASRCSTGFSPRTAANSDDTGGRRADLVRDVGGHALLPQARGQRVRAACSASPAIISEKKTPIDSAVPEFWKVERMPEARAALVWPGRCP